MVATGAMLLIFEPSVGGVEARWICVAGADGISESSLRTQGPIPPGRPLSRRQNEPARRLRPRDACAICAPGGDDVNFARARVDARQMPSPARSLPARWAIKAMHANASRSIEFARS